MYIQQLESSNWIRTIEKVKAIWREDLTTLWFELARDVQYHGFLFKNENISYYLKWFNSTKFKPHFKLIENVEKTKEEWEKFEVSTIFYTLSLKDFFVEANVNMGEMLSVDNVKLFKYWKLVKQLEWTLFDKRLLQNINESMYPGKRQRLWSFFDNLSNLQEKFIITWIGELNFILYACKLKNNWDYEFVEQKISFDDKIFLTKSQWKMGLVIDKNSEQKNVFVFAENGIKYNLSQELIHQLYVHYDVVSVIDEDLGTLWAKTFQVKDWVAEIVNAYPDTRWAWMRLCTNGKNQNENVKTVDVRPFVLFNDTKNFYLDHNITALQAFSETKNWYVLQNMWTKRAMFLLKKNGLWEMGNGILVDYTTMNDTVYWVLLEYDLNKDGYLFYGVIIDKNWVIVEKKEVWETKLTEKLPQIKTLFLLSGKNIHFISDESKSKTILITQKEVKELDIPNVFLRHKLKVHDKWYVWENNWNAYVFDEKNLTLKGVDRYFLQSLYYWLPIMKEVNIQKKFDKLTLPINNEGQQLSFPDDLITRMIRNEAIESCLYQENVLVSFWNSKYLMETKEMKKINPNNLKKNIMNLHIKYPYCLSTILTSWQNMQTDKVGLEKSHVFLNLKGKKLY